METEHQIVQAVYAAKEDSQKADDLILAYLPFIRSEATKTMGRICTDQDDEYAIAMTGFYEAILGYIRGRGAFLSYAATVIRSRILDFRRKEVRHQGQLSLMETQSEEDDRTLMDTLADDTDHFALSATREATRQEILELSQVMARFGVSFSDVADNCPKQTRTLESCGAVVRYAAANPPLLELLLQTGRLPMRELSAGTGVALKTLERHRKYILAMLLAQTNGYEIIRGHLRSVLKGKEEIRV